MHPQAHLGRVARSSVRLCAVVSFVACGGIDSRASEAAYAGDVIVTSAEVGGAYSILPLDSGSFAVASDPQTGLVMMYDARDSVSHAIGRVGQGPGEYELAWGLERKADSILIFDASGRVLVFDLQRRFVRQFRSELQAGFETIAMRHDTLLVSASMRDRERFGFPLHVVSPEGAYVRSFGAEDRSTSRIGEVFFLAKATDSSVWLARSHRYELEHWHIDGRLLSRVRVDRDYFPPREPTRSKPLEQERPLTNIKDIGVIPGVGLSVLLTRARSDWVASVKTDETAEHSNGLGKETTAKSPSLGSRLRWVEQIIEIIDPEDGHLIASHRLDSESFFVGLREDAAVGVREDRDGIERAVFVKVRSVPSLRRER
jgi:hypothetical protein